MNVKTVNAILKVRARHHRPPPNPLEDPIAHIKRPLRPVYPDRRGDGAGRRSEPVIEFDPIEVQLIRMKFVATQAQFARLIGISPETLRNWETGRRRPHGPARALLRAIDADPFALARALNWRARDFKEVPIDMLDE